METYSVNFTIHEVRDMVTPNSKAIDPLVVVRCCGHEFRTPVKYDKIGIVSFEVSHAWPQLAFTREAFQGAYLVFELQAANAFWYNDIVGQCAVQLSTIRARSSHTLKKYLPLVPPNETTLTGHLKVTISVLGSGDVLSAAAEEIEEEGEIRGQLDETLEAAILKTEAPKRTNGIPYHLWISIYRVEDLASDMNPYVTCEFSGSRLETNKARGSKAVSFNEGFRIPVVAPLQEDSIIISLWNSGSTEQLVAQGLFSFTKIVSKGLSGRWFNFYGLDPLETSLFTTQDWDMVKAKGMGEGTCYLGRILIGARATRVKSLDQLLPAQKVASRPRDEPPPVQVTFLVDAFEIDLDLVRTEHSRPTPPSTRELAIRVSCGSATEQAAFLRATQEGDRARYQYTPTQGRLPPLAVVLPRTDEQQPDVVIDVITKSSRGNVERIGYRRLKTSDIPLQVNTLQSISPIWIPLRNTFTHYSDGITASVLVSIEKSKSENVIRGRRRRIIVAATYMLRCYVYAARHLPFRHSSRQKIDSQYPNPYVRVTCGGASAATAPSSKTRHPVFLECLELRCRLAIDAYEGVPALTPIIVEVLSSEKKEEDQRLGVAICAYNRVLGKAQRQTKKTSKLLPEWIRLHEPGSKYVESDAILQCLHNTQPQNVKSIAKEVVQSPFGDLLCAFELLKYVDAKELAPQPLMPKVQETTVRLSLWGLQNLLPPTTQPVIKAATMTRVNRGPNFGKKVKRPVVVIHLPTYIGSLGGEEESKIIIPWSSQTDLSLKDQTLSHNSSWTSSQYKNEFSFSMHFTTGFKVFIPEDPIFDPQITIRVYDSKIESTRFIGESTLPLLSVLPWFRPEVYPEFTKACKDLIAKDSFMEKPSLMVLLKARELALTAMNALVRQKAAAASNRRIALDAIQKADTMSEAETVASVSDNTSGDSVDEAGVPRALRNAQSHLAKLNFFLNPIPKACLNANIRAPERFVVYVEGKPSDPLVDESTRRPSLDGDLEACLTDIPWRGRPLIRPLNVKSPLSFVLDNNIIQSGSIRMELGAGNKDDFRSFLPPHMVKIAFHNEKMRKEFKNEKAMPATLRARFYVLRAMALINPLNVTATGETLAEDVALARPLNPYLVFSFGSSRVENLRGSAKTATSNPKFHWVQELDIKNPEEMHVEIAVWSREAGNGENDLFLGSTLIEQQSLER